MHFDMNIFEKTIEPLLQNESTDYAKSIQYWVYSVKSTLADGRQVTYDSAIYTNPLASEANALSEDTFQTLYDDLLAPEVRTLSITSSDVDGGEELYVGYA